MADKECALPYKIWPQQSLQTFFSNIYTITEEQREFMWTSQKYVLPILNELFDAYKKDQHHWMGIFIILSDAENGKNTQSIWDAQHRFTLIILIIISIAYSQDISEKSKEKFLSYVCRWRDDDSPNGINEMDDRDGSEILTTRDDWTRVPNLRSQNENDFECLGALVNGQKPEAENNSLIYKAYLDIDTFIQQKSVQEKRDFLKFVMNKIFIDKMVITQKDFAYTVFYHINSIKVPLPIDVICKNRILAMDPSLDSEKINNLFRNLKQYARKFDYKINYILFLASVFCNKTTITYDKFLDHGQILYEESSIYDTLENVFDTIVNAISLVRNHILFPIIQHLTQGQDIFTYYLVPLVCLYPNQINDILTMFIAVCIRRNFNDKKRFYFNKRIIAPLFTGTSDKASLFQTFFRISPPWAAAKEQLLQFWHRFTLCDKIDFIHQFSTFSMTKNEKIFKHILLFVWYMTDSHESIPDFSSVDLEHIVPKAKKECKNIDVLGNLTLFVASNSGSLKGNRSLQDKPFFEKLEMYKRSNLKMNRELICYEKTNFGDPQIEQRTKKMILDLEKLSREILEI